MIRETFEPLREAFLRDYKLCAGWSSPSCDDTNVQSTPMDRMNKYQRHFSAAPETLTVMVLTLEFLLVQNLLED